jgi:hypothetical protein
MTHDEQRALLVAFGDWCLKKRRRLDCCDTHFFRAVDAFLAARQPPGEPGIAC